jgi:integrase
MYTTGDKLLNVMKEEEIGIAELARISGVPERTILDIMAGVKEPELGVIIETTKTDAGTRVLPITEDVAQMFQAIIEDRNAPKVEKSIDGYSGFLFYDDNGMPLVAMHWQHRFNHMVGRYNDIYRVQMPNITPHVCRHTYCSNMAKSGMNPKTLQYLMGHSDISVTMNVYTHIGFDDAEEELKRMEEFRKAQAEVEQKKEKPMSQKMFKVV